MSDIHKRIKSFRESLKVSASDLAMDLGEKADRYRNQESGKQRVTGELLKLLVLRKSANAHWLLTGEGQMFAGQGGSLSEEIPNQAYTQSELINNQRKARIESFIEHWFETMPDDDQAWLEGQMKRCITEYNDFISDKTIGPESRKSRA